MKKLLIETLEKTGSPVYLHGSIAEDMPYPERFITFLTLDSPDVEHFDGEAWGTSWSYQICNYGTDPLTVAEDAAAIRGLLKEAGFIPQGKGHDLPSDEPTHTGWVTEYLYLEMEERT